MKKRTVFKIGTRQSKLALAQAKFVQNQLMAFFPSLKFHLVKIKTYGDEYQSVEIFKKKNIGFFTKEIEKRLLAGQIDIAVHSLKDLPTDLAPGLCLGAVPKREDARDVVISKKRSSLFELPKNALVGTASPRRKRQLALLRPDLRLVDMRGNLDTRVKKVLMLGSLDAIIIAKAGLNRLGSYLKYAKPLSLEQMYPAVGQAALGIQLRSNDLELLKLVQPLEHKISRQAVDLERDFLRALRGGCRVPVGVHTQIKNDHVFFKARVFSVSDHHVISGQIHSHIKNASKSIQKLAKKMLKDGAKKILHEARNK